MSLKYILFILFISICSHSYSQIDSTSNELIEFDTDSLIISNVIISDSSLITKKKPGRAALFSAVLPGAGQAYNNKYWKIPVVYTAIGGIAFSFNLFNNQYKKYLRLYHQAIDSTLEITIINKDDLDEQSLLTLKDSNRRNRDLSAVVLLVIYVLNIVDASVDAHMSDFDVSEDLSIKIRPEILPIYSTKNNNAIGLTLSFKF